MDAVFSVPEPRNEPVRDYAPDSAERERLQRRLGELAADRLDLPMTIGGDSAQPWSTTGLDRSSKLWLAVCSMQYGPMFAPSSNVSPPKPFTKQPKLNATLSPSSIRSPFSHTIWSR